MSRGARRMPPTYLNSHQLRRASSARQRATRASALLRAALRSARHADAWACPLATRARGEGGPDDRTEARRGDGDVRSARDAREARERFIPQHTCETLPPLPFPRYYRGYATGDSKVMALVALLEGWMRQGEEGGSILKALSDRRATGKAKTRSLSHYLVQGWCRLALLAFCCPRSS